ncbi:MAG: hypothetical protein ACK5QF_17830 [Dolichospermum sp.]
MPTPLFGQRRGDWAFLGQPRGDWAFLGQPRGDCPYGILSESGYPGLKD